MKKPIPKIRVFGQRSIAHSFPSRSSIPLEGSKKVEKCASFSEFLDSKLNKSVPKNIEEGPTTPFTSLVCLTKFSKKYSDGGLEKTILEQFKPKENQISEEMSTGKASREPLLDAQEMDQLISCSSGISEDIIVKDDKISKKRKDPFEGMESINRRGKAVIVFGDNSKVSKPTQRQRESNKNNKQRPTYNHYANGSGWWDSDMEGVDSEEVGHSEVWEGVGSTTFGDILDWH